MTDSELLSHFISKQDQDAFTALIRRYERLVWSVCIRQLRNRCDAEDAFQSTFLLLATKANRIRDRDSVSNWLYGTAWRVSSRIRSRRATRSFSELETLGEDVADSSETQIELIARQHEIDLVDQHLQAMNPTHRTPLVLYYFAGLTVKQIADQLELTVAATEGRLRRARARLRRDLRHQGLHYSPVVLFTLLGQTVLSRANLISITTKQCVPAGVGSKVGVPFEPLRSGTKLMICKALCAAGISSILAVGGLLHLSPDTGQRDVVQVVDSSAVGSETTSLSIALADVPFCCPLQYAVTTLGAQYAQYGSPLHIGAAAVMKHASALHDF